MTAVNDWLEVHRIALETGAARRRFASIFKELNVRYQDNEPVRDAALLAAAKYLTGDITPAEVGKTLAAARRRADSQLAAARIISELAVADGAGETHTAREVGVDRMALRKWLGKR